MKEWYNKKPEERLPEKPLSKKKPHQLWTKCPACQSMIYNVDLEANMYVCPECDYHFRLDAKTRIKLLFDEKSFKETEKSLESSNPLNFADSTSTYDEKIKKVMEKTKLKEAVITGSGKINGIKVMGAVLDFSFFGGSMASVVGEKITRTIERAMRTKTPLVIVSASGGARMQEGILSLMQMAKTSAALARLSEKRVPYISVLTDPTTGGVTASFAMLGDIIIAEPGALIGFAGPRVIEQTIKQKLPPGFQRSEFLLEHGLIDMVVHRKELKDTIANIIKLLY